jgi:hypothetical protein
MNEGMGMMKLSGDYEKPPEFGNDKSLRGGQLGLGHLIDWKFTETMASEEHHAPRLAYRKCHVDAMQVGNNVNSKDPENEGNTRGEPNEQDDGNPGIA